jgi:UDP-3-O-[3-hydroxymyristoyl] glucosamine N-acyltransferase
MRVRELADLLGLPFEGEGEREILRASALEDATADAIAFVGNAKAARLLDSAAAGCVILPDGAPLHFASALRAKDPRAAFARAVALLHPSAVTPGIHPSAAVASGAMVSPEASVGPFCSIAAGASIGAGVILYSGVTVYSGVSIGERTIVHAGSVLGADGFGFAFTGERYEKFPQIGRVEIGADCEIGANCCIDRAALGVTVIGEGTKLDNMVHVGHNVRIGRHVVIAAQTGISGGVTIGDYAVIGGQVGIGDKARIEERAIVGSGAGILPSKIVRGGQPMWGTPAQPLKDHLEQLAHLRRLEELRGQVRELTRRLDEITEGKQ